MRYAILIQNTISEQMLNTMELDIKSLIGETTAYDKKQMLEVRRPKSWLKSVSAFANGERRWYTDIGH